MFVLYSPFKYVFKIVHMPVFKVHTLKKKKKYDDKMCIALM